MLMLLKDEGFLGASSSFCTGHTLLVARVVARELVTCSNMSPSPTLLSAAAAARLGHVHLQSSTPSLVAGRARRASWVRTRCREKATPEPSLRRAAVHRKHRRGPSSSIFGRAVLVHCSTASRCEVRQELRRSCCPETLSTAAVLERRVAEQIRHQPNAD